MAPWRASLAVQREFDLARFRQDTPRKFNAGQGFAENKLGGSG